MFLAVAIGARNPVDGNLVLCPVVGLHCFIVFALRDDLVATAQIGPYDHMTTSEWSALRRTLRGLWRKWYVVSNGRHFGGRFLRDCIYLHGSF
jgi:hypothetical protein